MGPIFLGMPGPWAEDSRESADHYTTKIGGVPDWPNDEIGRNGELSKCRLCGGRLTLIAQIYAPLSTDQLCIEERTLYIFACLTNKCAADPLSWRTLRIQKCSGGAYLGSDCHASSKNSGLNVSVSEAENSLENDLWSMDDGDNIDMDLEELSKALSEASSLASVRKKQNSAVKSKPVCKESKLKSIEADRSIPVMPCFYTYFKEEPQTVAIKSVCSQYASLSIEDDQNHASETSDEEKWEGESYEYDQALRADRTYLKFKKRMDLFPEQCFRYSYGGQLLSPSPSPSPIACETGKCHECGALLHYEMQLMPSLLYFLNQGAGSDTTGPPEEWDWVTAIIYTCSKSCFHEPCKGTSDSTYWTVVEETTVLQLEGSG